MLIFSSTLFYNDEDEEIIFKPLNRANQTSQEAYEATDGVTSSTIRRFHDGYS